MRSKWQEYVRTFMRTAGQAMPGIAAVPDEATVKLRIRLIREELEELEKAYADNDVVQIADAYGDLIYVTIGGALATGIDLDYVLDAIQSSNMAKFPGGKPILDAGGKVIKPEGWQPPDIGAALVRAKQEGDMDWSNAFAECNHASWPAYPREIEPFIPGKMNDLGYRGCADEALAILMLAGIVVPLGMGGFAGVHADEATVTLHVLVNDTFAYACADCERIPPIGFGLDRDLPFWDLYDRCRAFGGYGAVQWVALQRKSVPITPRIVAMKAAGAWPEEMEKLYVEIGGMPSPSAEKKS